MADGKCLANRLCNAMGGPTALAMYDGPAAVRDAVSSELANMQSDATAASRIARNELMDVEFHAIRIVRKRAAAARHRRKLRHLRDKLHVKDARLERMEPVPVEFTASIKRLEAKLAELTASVKRLEVVCSLLGAAGVGGMAGGPVAPSPASHAPLFVPRHDFASVAPQPRAAAGQNADALEILEISDDILFDL